MIIRNKPIRVLHVFGKLDTGGAERRVLDIYRSIDKSKIQFDFMVHTEEESIFDKEIISLGGNVYRVPRFKGHNYLSYKNSWKSFFQNNNGIDIIHGHQTSTAFIYMNIAKKAGISYRISHARNSNTDNYLKYLLTRIGKFYSNNYFAVSKLAGIAEFGQGMVDKGNVRVIPNAIDAQKYTFNLEKRLATREKLHLEDKFIIGHIGRFREQKNHEFVIDVFNEYYRRNKNSKLLLIGTGPLEDSIKKKVKEYKINNSVEFLGIRNDIPDLLQAFDVLLLPSFYEGMPGVVLEAQAAGLPSIISDTITSEVKITDYVNYLPINRGTTIWYDEIERIRQKSFRRDTFLEIKNKKFDIQEVSILYEKLYLDLFK